MSFSGLASECNIYKTRTHSTLSGRIRQYLNGDFEKFRFRLNVRDTFWYRKAHPVSNRVFDAPLIF